MKLYLSLLAIFVSIGLLSCGGNSSQSNQKDTTATTQTQTTSAANIEVNPEKNCYFGDLHLHTTLSVDANLFGTTLGSEDAYKYAMGEEVEYLGQKVKRIAPLDFLAVTDHGEYIGVLVEVRKPGSPIGKTDLGKLLTSPKPEDQNKGFLILSKAVATSTRIPEIEDPEVFKSSWQRVINAAEQYNKPGKFTTFIGYEWTSAPATSTMAQQNLHRCVIFKGDKVPDEPFSSLDSQNPEDLWTYLENARKNGSDVIAVPHNGNISNGLMFDTKTLSGQPLTKSYAERRMLNEPLTEMMQAKGQSDTRPELSPNDEFANYEVYENLLGSTTKGKYKTGSFVRQAYGTGQELEEKIGANPFKFGLEGGSDFHSALSSTEENNYPGSHGTTDDLSKNYNQILTQTSGIAGEPPVKLAAAGLTGVWAESNTRDAIFDALKRKECFATSGGRIKVRMFAGWNYTADVLKQTDWVKDAYANGVPMGADLPAGTGKPKFLVQAIKDPNSGNLDRIQIIKVITKNGKSSEKIYDVVWSGNRKPDAKGKLPPVGNTVDIKTATYQNTIGSAELTGYWEDPDFDPQAYATYYARVLEIPTPRWSTYLAAKHNLPLSKLVDSINVERAWTSPVWYTPTK
jgi:hypothetical protein